MPLSLNEIRANAIAFSREWKDDASEDAEAKSFWDAFFNVFGITRRRVAAFEIPVKKSDGKGGYIDLLWKGKLLVEHKSRGLDLDRAYHQATDYFHGLKERDLPRYVLVSDFARFRLYDLEGEAEPYEFPLKNLHRNIRRFDFISGYQTRSFGQQDPVNIEAAEKLGKLHDLLKDAGYQGHPLEVFLVRVLFCLFAEDNAIFEPQQFREWIEQRTSEDGSDLGPLLAQLFQTLDTPPERRDRNLDEHLAAFRYINGRLFEENIRIASLDRAMREMVLDCCGLDWSRISPAIFGALFQSIMDKKARRNLGAHYTSETNILKALEPLFLDSLRAEFQRIRRDSNRLKTFHQKLGNIRILDPACGCGNFLVIAYRELRLLELDVLRALFPEPRGQHLDVSPLVFVDVDQFYGIELEEFPAQIAQVALWMTDHQMNQKVSEEFGQYFARLPLVKSPTITHGNALTLDWKTVVSPDQLSYIVGNPPFGGKHYQGKTQKAELVAVFGNLKNSSDLDYVAAWYRKATDLMADNPNIQAALVSTNSITQGEQVGILWPDLLNKGLKIHFAHRTFQWSSEARGRAAVHCVIIGFALHDTSDKSLFEYETLRSAPNQVRVANINPYLINADDLVVKKRTKPLCPIPVMRYGNKPSDDGNFILSEDEMTALVTEEPRTEKLIRPYLGSDDFINGIRRYCIWLDGFDPQEWRSIPVIVSRVERVRAFRQASSAEPTRKSAQTPSIFFYISQPNSPYLVIPEVSSERRHFIPIGFMTPRTVCSNTNYLVPNATPYMFGILTSTMHMAWMRTVCGRLESRYRYAGSIVYNNFPWPEPTEKQRAAIESAAQAVLDERARHPGSTLADLYDPLSMPPGLVKAHQTLDRAVDAAYGRTSFTGEAERVAFLFTLYEKLTSLFPTEKKKPPRRRPAVL